MREVTFDLPVGTFHALQVDQAGGPPRRVVYLHGFPDIPSTAGRFLGELGVHGHSILAPWLRGYSPSPCAPPFDLVTLAGDVRALIDQWSPDEPVDLVGHDWGALLTYLLCLTASDRVRRAVTLAVPHPLTFVGQLRTLSQLRASWYMGLFQLPGAAVLVRRNRFALIDRLWATWSPGFTLPEVDRHTIHACLADSLAPLEYYRAARRDGVRLTHHFAPPIVVPLLALHGADDGCIMPPTRDDARRFRGAYEHETLPDLGHFLHLEAPAQVAARIAAWLR